MRNEGGLSAARGPKPAEQNLLVGTHLAAPPAGDGVVGERAEADESGRATRGAREWH